LRSKEGVLSLPLRLAVSMLVVSLALPICIQSISDGRRELSRTSCMELSEEIARMAEEVSSKPVGESRIIELDVIEWTEGKSIRITVGCILGENNFSVIRCTDDAGWSRLVQVDLSPSIVGLCSFDLRPFTISGQLGDLVISHVRHSCGEIVQVGFV
jgi:hypothetical protein